MEFSKNKTINTTYYIFRILPEFILLAYFMGTILLILPVVSLLILGHNAYSHYKSKPKKRVKFYRIFNMVYSVLIFLNGCMWLAGGNFGAFHAPIFFFIGVYFCVLEILKYFLIDLLEFAPILETKQKKNMVISLVLMGMLFTSLFVGTVFLSRRPPIYTQEDLDNATIVYLDVGINGSLAPYEVEVYKTWHSGEDYLTSDFIIISPDCYIHRSYIYDRNFMAEGGSVSGMDGRTTIKMTDNEGWVYFYVYWLQDEGVYYNDLENRTDPAYYTFMITSHHLNFLYPV